MGPEEVLCVQPLSSPAKAGIYVMFLAEYAMPYLAKEWQVVSLWQPSRVHPKTL